MTAESLRSDDRKRLAQAVWREKYRAPDEAEISDSWWRVARSIASAEPEDQQADWASRFFGILEDYRFLPGGRILASAGRREQRTLFNCFVMDRIEDSMAGIFRVLGESAITMQQGGGIGVDFSTLRPDGTPADHTGGQASGPVSFMRIWESMCATLLETNARRGAMMATLRCDHPDIEAFIAAKETPGAFVHFNLSVLVSDDFMRAVRGGGQWPLVFPDPNHRLGATRYLSRCWSGHMEPVACAVLREVPAAALWERLLRASYEASEPGVLFVDRINQQNNLAYRELITATNPCGEIPLPPNGACDLGSINLARFVSDPFTPEARLQLDQIRDLVPVAVRFLDNVIDVSRYPLEAQAAMARQTRRIGLGITGLGDSLIMLNHRYDTPEARALAARVMATIRDAAYEASIGLAREKGRFPAHADSYADQPFIRRLPDSLRERVRRHGTRNSHLLAIAPAGSISLLAGNVSSGVEPVYATRSRRHVRDAQGRSVEWSVDAYSLACWRACGAGEPGVPPALVTAEQLTPAAHVDMQAALQPLVDNAISKTVNVPAGIGFEDYRSVYDRAYDHGTKGCTTYRPGGMRQGILQADHEVDACCEVAAQDTGDNRQG